MEKAPSSPLKDHLPQPQTQDDGASADPSTEHPPTWAPGTRAHSTQSTDSMRTVRGDDTISKSPRLPATPSYPFPITSGTPLLTPGTHQPFTVLSPTVTPNPTQAAKHKISQEFRASGLLPRAPTTSTLDTPRELSSAFPNLSKPNLLEVAVHLQSELGLPYWWSQVSKTLKESFGAERATLAVATDATDVENVPWAQLATYWTGEDDGLSRATNDAESSRSSLRDVVSPMPATSDRERTTSGSSSSKVRFLGQMGHPASVIASRPRLETRHSYTGYPSRHKPTASDSGIQVSSAIAQLPTSPSFSTHSSLRDIMPAEPGLSLNEELLRRHNNEVIATGSMSDDFTLSGKALSGKVLQPPQPLESEADPLITTSGILKVLGRDRPFTLTREYLSYENDPSESQGNQARVSPGKPMSNTKRSPGIFTSRAVGGKSGKRRVASTKDSLTVEKALPKSATKKVAHGPAYEDYEQFPGTPWTQSPAPSPAARADPEDNPFFTNQPDHNAFADDPPEQPYPTQSPIAAIGVDRSQTILQIPLIHPSSRLSHSVNSRMVRGDTKAKPSSHRVRAERRSGTRQESSMSSENVTTKRVPIAILSVLAPNVPYPVEMIDSLNELAPLLAASFYAARSHSNVLQELSAVSGRRRPGDFGVSARDSHNFGSMPGSMSMAYDRSRDRMFSPASPMSSASASTQSITTFQVNRDSGGFQSAVASPIIDSFDEMRRISFERPMSAMEDVGRDTPSDYFSRKVQSDEKTRTPTTPGKVGGFSRPGTSANKKRVIHSQGANFATTQPSLPSAAYSTADDGPDSGTPSELATFKEPSSSVLRTMIDNGATQQFIAEPEHGRLIWANSKFMAYRNASKENIHEQLWMNIYPKDISRFQKEWNKSLETGEQLSHQVRLKRFDGHFRYFHMRFLPLKDRYGVTKYWHGQAMDIHDLHEAEAKAAKSKEKLASEARYRAIANSLPVIVFAASVPSGMTFANTQWLSYSGQDLEEALGFGFLEHVHPEDLGKCRFPGFEAGAKVIPDPLRNSPPTLARNDGSASSTAGSEETGDTSATIKDPGGLKDASNELDIPNELLRELANDGIILYARDQQGNLSITTEMRLKNRNGEYRWHLVQGSFIDSVNFGQGEARWFIACTDISNQKQNEAKIQHANSSLEEVNSALEKEMKQKMNYLSSMSHEIRTPLNGIIGNLQFLINSGLDEPAADWAHGAQEAARNMHDLINDILDLSKAEANMLQLTSHWFNPRDLMEQILDMLNSKVAERGIELSIECAEDVPQTVRGDSQRIRQVLLNLVGNAIKFTRDGEVTIKCDVLGELPAGSKLPEARSGERFIRWFVTDSGSGFTPEDRKLLFKPYSQLKNKNTRDSGGTGLGLILCKTMVTLHGGAIDATSKPGLGSTFSFFARFRVRPEKNTIPLETARTQLVMPNVVASELKPNSPSARSITPTEGARDSPAVLSDSSSAVSVTSTDLKPSVRSSASTADSHSPIKLTMPLHPTAPRSPDVSLSPTTKPAEPITSIRSPDLKPTVIKPSSPRSATNRTAPTMPPRRSSLQRTTSIDLERASFRPPMISALVICSADNARRVTHEQIRQAVPQSVPCSITSQATVDGALELLTGNDPIIFTHIVVRLTADDAMLRAVNCVLSDPQHSRSCVVVLAHQEQLKYLQRNAPNLNLEELSKHDRLKMVMKPAHTFKLAKIFDPFNENALAATDPKEAKRQEEKRLQKEAYDLFKAKLGNKGMRVMAVEDNALQMNILNNFLAKICCLDVTKSWNGQECFDLFKTKGRGHYSVIITDIEMPVMDGLTMCRRIREFEAANKWSPINLVSLSAHTFSEGWNQSSEAGFSHYCPKPVQFRDLGHILLELSDPRVPHKFLRERQMPRPMLKKLGLLPLDEEDSEEEEEGGD